MPTEGIHVLRGDSPLVLVAPHGGRRDADERPWHRGGLKTNDLHTPALTRELARRTGASALVNDAYDRNVVDLNRIDQIHDRLPEFLDGLTTLVRDTIARHGRATLLTIHGWNTTAPEVDLGLGCRPGTELEAPAPGASASASFCMRSVVALQEACARHDLTARVGRRYPARAAQNLVQLFTQRYAGDDRPAIAALAALADRCDAMQIELAVPLRWPGPWREAFVAAFCEAAAALGDPHGTAGPGTAPTRPSAAAAKPPGVRVEFVSPGLSGLVGIDGGGGRVLLVDADGQLTLFTRERITDDAPHRVAGLEVGNQAGEATVTYRGPCSRFPDTEPFTDLEAGLARSQLVTAEVTLRFVPAHAHDPPCPFGHVTGHVRVDGRRTEIHATAFLGDTGWPNTVARLHVDDGMRLVASPPGRAGLLCNGTDHRAVEWQASTTALALDLDATTPTGPLAVRARAVHRIPIVRGGTSPATSVALATYAVDGRPTGWGQVVESGT